MKFDNVKYFWRDPRAIDRFQCGVSLHSHTSLSHESLGSIPEYARKSGVLSKLMDIAEWQHRSRTGQPMDMSRAYWTPPLQPKTAARLETDQIEKKLGLRAMVSLTDHDKIDAGIESDTVISTEWTVPYRPSFFHIGVHNLPAASARAILAELHSFTRDPVRSRLGGMLSMLDELPETLTVLNHPHWDEGLIGQAAQEAMAQQFMEEFGEFIHAIELNGLRPESETQSVIAAAEQWGLPVISGGDRHGREPNANINLTDAASFAEFVYEVRQEGRSEVLFMPQYREPLRLRRFETAWDILRFDPDRQDGRSCWSDRVFYIRNDGTIKPLSYYFGGTGPLVLMPLLAIMRLLETRPLRPALRLALADSD